MEVLEGRLTLVFPAPSPLIIDPDGAATQDAEDLDGVAVIFDLRNSLQVSFVSEKIRRGFYCFKLTFSLLNLRVCG